MSVSDLLANRFLIDNGDGTVTDVQTGLQWMRYALGQEWIEGTCTGDAKLYTWPAAMDAAEALNWRIPTVEELHTLIRVYDIPTIGELVFPNTSKLSFWSSVRDWKQDKPIFAWSMCFDNRQFHCANINNFLYVRLVRSKADLKYKAKQQERIKQETLRRGAKARRQQEQIKQEALRREAEARRAELLLILRTVLRNDFNRADLLFKTSCADYISTNEYEQEKASFVQNWVKETTGTELDTEQAIAVASVHGHIQVIARAGSGKTTTLVNRALFLQKHCGVAPDEMLLLAFNRKAAEEIAERLSKMLDDGVPHVMTFHALAYAIVHPEGSLLYNGPPGESQGLSRAFQQVVDDHLQIPAFKAEIRELMLAHFREDWDRIAKGGYDKSKEELLQFRRSLPRESLRGEYVKSFGEKVIADFLFEHDISYKYERNHWWGATNYRPDFTIFKTEKSGVIIEYFGLEGDSDYDEMSQAKRNYWSHKRDWVLLEFFPQDVTTGGIKNFRELLRESLELSINNFLIIYHYVIIRTSFLILFNSIS